MENLQLVDQKLARVIALIRSRPALFARQGCVVTTWRTYQQRKLGPYYRLAFREGGRQRSIYLGTSKETSLRVEALLVDVQKPTKVKAVLRRTRASLRASLRQQKKELDGLLRDQGLLLKGFEVRGWASNSHVFGEAGRPTSHSN